MNKALIKFIILITTTFLFAFYILITPVLAFSPTDNDIYTGIDVSSWQENIDFSQVKNSGVDIVYIKASEGTGMVDQYLNQYYSDAKASGLKIGFYHYLTATTTSDAINQADFFVSTINGTQPDCKLAMDFESFNGLDNYSINQIALAFMQEVKNASGKDVIIYSDAYNATSTFNSNLNIYPLWVAQYDVSEPSATNWNNWSGWQYTDQGEVPGISGYVDMDQFTDNVFLSDNSSINSSSNINNNQSSNSYSTIIIPYGSTLSELAIEYNTTIARLVELNNIANPNLIYAGNTLVIPTSESYYTSNSSTIYIVKYGDTLSQIALNYNTTVIAIADANNISNVNLIYVGQILTIPTSAYHDTSHVLYVVKSGDTLWSISGRFGVSIAKIVMLNRIANPNLIYPGNILRI